MQAISTVPYAPPKHVAIIMDGNGRWAKARGLPRIAGHRKGAEAVRRTVEAPGELGIPYLTLFGFSSENWKRPEGEVVDLMGLLRLYLRSEIAELHRNGVRLRVIGDRAKLSADIVTMIGNAEELTRGNTELNLTIALSYGGRARRSSGAAPSDGARSPGRAAAPRGRSTRKASPPACSPATFPTPTC